MSIKTTTLHEKRQDLTRGLILDGAFALLKEGAVPELTVRAVAQHAGMSERTVFRYFPARDALLDAVADYLRAHMATPALQVTLDGLLAAPGVLYRAFEERADHTRAALHPDLVGRVRSQQADVRWKAVHGLLESIAPQAGAAQRRIAAANVCYHLTASSWNYYRTAFGFGLEESIACAETAVSQALQGLGAAPGKAA